MKNIGYTADVLQSAQQLADHAARPGAPKIEKEDVEVAIQMRKRQEFFEPPPRDVRQSLPRAYARAILPCRQSDGQKLKPEQYLSSIAQELNAQPLPILSETFDILRLPPPHQRIAEVNFNIVPDRDLVLSEEEEDDDSDEEEDEEEEDAKSEEATIGRPAEEAEGSDEEMEEVGIGAERVVDEDYDA